jgi:hypothetical protein
MSRSLNRIRSLVSEIEQIQKRGQLGDSLGITHRNEFAAGSVKDPVIETPTDQAEVIQLPLGRGDPGRVSVKLSGAVVLELQVEDSNERVELRRVGDAIEIRFSDGKAVHIPFRAVA